MSIVITGAYGFDNVGDEAMLNVILSNFKESFPHTNLVVSCTNQNLIKKLHHVDTTFSISPLSLLKKLFTRNFVDFKKQIKIINEMKVLVYGGGSLFSDSKGKRNIFIILTTLLILKALNKPVVLWGVSIGPVNTIIGKIIVRQILKMTYLILVRDGESQKLVNKLCNNNCQVIEGVDLLFDKKLLTKKNRVLISGACLYIGISLRPFPAIINTDFEDVDDMLISSLVMFFTKLTKEVKVKIIPLVFSEGQDRRDDLAMLNRLLERLPNSLHGKKIGGFSKYVNLSAEESLNSMLSSIGGLDIVIGERFHSLVASTLQAVPFVSISYDEKVKQIAKLTKMEKYCVDLQCDNSEKALAEDFFYKTSCLLNDYEKVSYDLRATLLDLIEVSCEGKEYMNSEISKLL